MFLLFVLFLLFIVGIGLLIKGAAWLVNTSKEVAHSLGISDFIIGLTVVAMGTSLPEFVLSQMSAVEDKYEIVLGINLGSNITNLLLGVGCVLFLIRTPLRGRIILIDMGFGFLATLMLWALIFWGISADFKIGLVFLFIVGVYFYIIVKIEKNRIFTKKRGKKEILEKIEFGKKIAVVMMALLTLLIGGWLVERSSHEITLILGGKYRMEGVLKFVSYVLISVSTSAPELFVSILAAVKKNPQLALGNIFGSNIFNIFINMGMSFFWGRAVFQRDNVIFCYFFFLINLLLVLWAVLKNGKGAGRGLGLVLMILYTLFIGYMLLQI